MTAKDIIWVWAFAILCSSFAFKQEQKNLEFKKDILNEKEINEIIENELLHFDKVDKSNNSNGRYVYSRANQQ